MLLLNVADNRLAILPRLLSVGVEAAVAAVLLLLVLGEDGASALLPLLMVNSGGS